jgi:hypothetical protein
MKFSSPGMLTTEREPAENMTIALSPLRLAVRLRSNTVLWNVLFLAPLGQHCTQHRGRWDFDAPENLQR